MSEFAFPALGALADAAYNAAMNDEYSAESDRVLSGLNSGQIPYVFPTGLNGPYGAYGDFPNGQGGYDTYFMGYQEPGLEHPIFLDPVDYLTAGVGTAGMALKEGGRVLANAAGDRLVSDGLRAAREAGALVRKPNYFGTQLSLPPERLDGLRARSDAIMDTIGAQTRLENLGNNLGRSRATDMALGDTLHTFPNGNRNITELLGDIDATVEDAQLLQRLSQAGRADPLSSEELAQADRLMRNIEQASYRGARDSGIPMSTRDISMDDRLRNYWAQNGDMDAQSVFEQKLRSTYPSDPYWARRDAMTRGLERQQKGGNVGRDVDHTTAKQLDWPDGTRVQAAGYYTGGKADMIDQIRGSSRDLEIQHLLALDKVSKGLPLDAEETALANQALRSMQGVSRPTYIARGPWIEYMPESAQAPAPGLGIDFPATQAGKDAAGRQFLNQYRSGSPYDNQAFLDYNNITPKP